jgi:hypothetical protein
MNFFQLFGLIIFVPAILRFNDSAVPNEAALVPSLVFIAVGALILVLGFLGCCGALRESQCILAIVSDLNQCF